MTLTKKRVTRRAGQIGQINDQGRSHDAADCGTYRLIERTGQNLWKVEYISACDQDGYRFSELRFVSQDGWDHHF